MGTILTTVTVFQSHIRYYKSVVNTAGLDFLPKSTQISKEKGKKGGKEEEIIESEELKGSRKAQRKKHKT